MKEYMMEFSDRDNSVGGGTALAERSGLVEAHSNVSSEVTAVTMQRRQLQPPEARGELSEKEKVGLLVGVYKFEKKNAGGALMNEQLAIDMEKQILALLAESTRDTFVHDLSTSVISSSDLSKLVSRYQECVKGNAPTRALSALSVEPNLIAGVIDMYKAKYSLSDEEVTALRVEVGLGTYKREDAALANQRSVDGDSENTPVPVNADASTTPQAVDAAQMNAESTDVLPDLLQKAQEAETKEEAQAAVDKGNEFLAKWSGFWDGKGGEVVGGVAKWTLVYTPLAIIIGYIALMKVACAAKGGGGGGH